MSRWERQYALVGTPSPPLFWNLGRGIGGGVNSTHMQSTIQLRIERTNCTPRRLRARIHAIEKRGNLNQKTIRFEKNGAQPYSGRYAKLKQIFFCSDRSPSSHPTGRNSRDTYSCFSYFLFENSSRGGPGEAGQELLLGEFARIVQILPNSKKPLHFPSSFVGFCPNLFLLSARWRFLHKKLF